MATSSTPAVFIHEYHKLFVKLTEHTAALFNDPNVPEDAKTVAHNLLDRVLTDLYKGNNGFRDCTISRTVLLHLLEQARANRPIISVNMHVMLTPQWSVDIKKVIEVNAALTAHFHAAFVKLITPLFERFGRDVTADGTPFDKLPKELQATFVENIDHIMEAIHDQPAHMSLGAPSKLYYELQKLFVNPYSPLFVEPRTDSNGLYPTWNIGVIAAIAPHIQNIVAAIPTSAQPPVNLAAVKPRSKEIVTALPDTIDRVTTLEQQVAGLQQQIMNLKDVVVQLTQTLHETSPDAWITSMLSGKK